MAEAATAHASICTKVKNFLQTQWFLTGVMICVAIAYPLREFVSDSSVINPKWTLKTPGVIMIFISQGVSLKKAAVVRAVKQWKIILFSFFCTFVVYPSITFGLVFLLRAAGYNSYLATGLVVLAIMPTTTAMSTILTTTAGGDVPTAIANATLGNIAGVFVTPLLAMLILASGGAIKIDLAPACIKLGYMILAPFAFGQILQLNGKIAAFATTNKRKLSIFNHVVLLVIILVSFANLYLLDSDVAGFGAADIAMQVGLGLALNWGMSVFVWLATWWMPLELRVAAFYVSVHKTVVMGLPMCDALFGTHPMASLFALPLILYHPAELATGSFIAPVLKGMVEAAQKKAAQGADAEQPAEAPASGTPGAARAPPTFMERARRSSIDSLTSGLSVLSSVDPGQEPEADAKQAAPGSGGGRAQGPPESPKKDGASTTASDPSQDGLDLEAVVMTFGEEAPGKPAATRRERGSAAWARGWSCLRLPCIA